MKHNSSIGSTGQLADLLASAHTRLHTRDEKGDEQMVIHISGTGFVKHVQGPRFNTYCQKGIKHQE